MGIIWKEISHLSQLLNLTDFALSAFNLKFSSTSSSSPCSYLLTSDHQIEVFSQCLADLEAAISAIQPMVSAIVAGDLNVHLTDPYVLQCPNSHEGLVH